MSHGMDKVGDFQELGELVIWSATKILQQPRITVVSQPSPDVLQDPLLKGSNLIRSDAIGSALV